MTERPTSPACEKLMREAGEISAMAEDLRNRGLAAEAVTFALIAAQLLRAIRATSRPQEGHHQLQEKGKELMCGCPNPSSPPAGRCFHCDGEPFV
jgi:hypothetical protein